MFSLTSAEWLPCHLNYNMHSLPPRPHPAFRRVGVLQVMESWEESGNEAICTFFSEFPAATEWKKPGSFIPQSKLLMVDRNYASPDRAWLFCCTTYRCSSNHCDEQLSWLSSSWWGWVFFSWRMCTAQEKRQIFLIALTRGLMSMTPTSVIILKIQEWSVAYKVLCVC